MTIAILVLSIFLLLLTIAVFVMAIVSVVVLSRLSKRVEDVESVRDGLADLIRSAALDQSKTATERHSDLVLKLRAIITVETQNNKFLAGYGVPPDPAVLERRKIYEDEMVAAGQEQGIPLPEIMAMMRESEGADYASSL